MRCYSQKARRATPQYGTYPPSSPTPDYDVSTHTLVLDKEASSPSQSNAPSPDGSPETSPLSTDDALVLYPSIVTSLIASTDVPPSVPAIVSTITEMERAGYLSKVEVINDVKDADSQGLAMVRYQPVLSTSSGRHGATDIPAFASSSTSENECVVAKHVLSAVVNHLNIQRKPTLDISAFISPQLESESVFKTFIPDVDFDGNRLSAILDQPLEFLDDAPLPDFAMVFGMDA